MNYRAVLSNWKNNVRFQPLSPVSCSNSTADTVLLQIDKENKRQSILGFGGAFTRASALLWNQLSAEKQCEVLRLYFDSDKANYSMCRTPIGGCDFAEYAYTLDDEPNDYRLEHFSVSPDLNTTIPMIKAAQAIRSGRPFRLYACPWSPPAWMKDTQRLEFGGRLLPAFYDVMANYLVRFVREYEAQGIPVWGLTAQNEPNECLRWPTCLYSAEEEATFLDQHLIPALDKAGYDKLAVMIWDNNKDLILERVTGTLEQMSQHADRIYGAAFHWYAGDHFDQLQAIRERYPKLHLLSTEACTALYPEKPEARPGVRYVHEMIGNFNHGACAFIDWNMFLDAEGGPSYVRNQCLSPITIFPETDSYRINEAYDAICHFSRYIRNDAVSIRVIQPSPAEAAAFMNPDGTVVAVVLNPTSEDLFVSLEEEIYMLPAESVCTLESVP